MDGLGKTGKMGKTGNLMYNVYVVFELGLDGYEAGWAVSVAKYFQSLVLRWDANRRAALLKAGPGRACARIRTRSLASRSRLIAPVGAPPLFVH